MKRPDKFEQDMLKAYDSGIMKSTSPTKADLAKWISKRAPLRKVFLIRHSLPAFCISTFPESSLSAPQAWQRVQADVAQSDAPHDASVGNVCFCEFE